MKKYALAIAALLTFGTVQSASAEVSVGISIGVPGVIYSTPHHHYGPPVYYAPPPVVVVPRTVYGHPHAWRSNHRERARHKEWRSHGGKHWHGGHGHGHAKHSHRGKHR